MREIFTLCFLILISSFVGCDMRSETAKREMEKFSGTPTPTSTPAPSEPPVDPSEVVKVDISVRGDMITISGRDQKKTVECSKFNRVMISGAQNVVTIKGGCQQITINGDGNQVNTDAALEFIVNGTRNSVTYSRFVNGKRPSIKENAPGNTIEKVVASETKK